MIMIDQSEILGAAIRSRFYILLHSSLSSGRVLGFGCAPVVYWQPQEGKGCKKCWAKTNSGEPNRQGFFTFFSSNFNLQGHILSQPKTLWVSQKPTCFDFSSSNFNLQGHILSQPKPFW
jgi:hypothetical protein